MVGKLAVSLLCAGIIGPFLAWPCCLGLVVFGGRLVALALGA